MLYVVKRDGREVEFNSIKISNAIKGAAEEIGISIKISEILELTQELIRKLEEMDLQRVTVEEIQNMVEETLLHKGYKEIGIAYSNYRKERTKVRDIKSDLMRAISQIGIETDRDNGATSCC